MSSSTSGDRLTAIVNNTDVAIIGKTLDGVVTSWNPAAERMFGYTSAESLGKPMQRLIPPEGMTEERDILAKVAQGESISHLETVRRCKDGRLLDVSVALSPIRNLAGKIVGASQIVFDISARKQAEAALDEADELRRQIIASVGEGLFVYDRELRYRVWNPFMEELLGLPAERVLGRHPAELFPEIRANGRLALIERALRGESITMPDAQPVTGPHRVAWVQTRLSPLRNARGEIVGVIGVVREITERKRAEDALRLARFAMERAALGIFWIEADGRIFDVNDAACAMLGYARGELVGLFVWDVDPDANAAEWNAKWQRLKQTGTLLAEARNRAKDGRILPVEVSANFIGFGERELKCVFVRDITRRKQAEETQRASEERYRLIVETAEEGIWMVGADGATSFVNLKMARMLGTTVEDVMRRPLADFIDPDYRERGQLHLERRRTGLREQYEFKFRRTDGTPLWAAVAASPVYEQGGNYAGSLRMISDITARKQSEEQLSRSQDNLRALGARLESAREEESVRIAREIHDELGQNLTAMKMDLTWLKRNVGEKQSPQEKIDAVLKLISTTVASVRRICSELRPSALDDIGLTAAIEAHALQFQARSGIRCWLSLMPDALELDPARSTALFRIFQEILTNVARHSHASRVIVSLQQADGHAVLEVQDNGKGFTEASVSDRNTLGLLGMNERALTSGGRVTIQSAPRKGTVVTVHFPLNSANGTGPEEQA